MQRPTEIFEDILTQPIAISCHARRVVHGSVAFDSDRVHPGYVWMPDGHVDAVARDTHLGLDAVAEAVWVKGMYANQNVVTKLRHPFTLQRLAEAFEVAE